MEETKLFGRTCPKCGELPIDAQFAKVHLASGVQVNMDCPQGHKWSEFYALTYQGYWWDGKRYNSCGAEEL